MSDQEPAIQRAKQHLWRLKAITDGGGTPRSLVHRDGVQDDGGSIQRQLDQGGYVHLPPGTFNVGSGVVMTGTATTLVGGGKAILTLTGASNCTVTGLQFGIVA